MSRKGFTLIELMIVVAIIAIIAAIAIPSLLNARRNSNQSAAMATVKNFGSAAVEFSTQTDEQYFWNNQTGTIADTDFGSSFAHSGIKGGYNFEYFSNSTDDAAAADAVADHDATKFVYVAWPVSWSTGRKAYYVDEMNFLWELSYTDAAQIADFAKPADADWIVAEDTARFADAAAAGAGAAASWVRK